MNIYSLIQPNKLLHIIIRKQDIPEGRMNAIAPDQFLQLATLRLPQHTTFRAHKHNWNIVESEPRIAQESWVIISGSVKVFMYDLDDMLLHTDVLTAGDISVTLEGGHNYEIMSENSRVLEFKTGPYISQEVDKTFINTRPTPPESQSIKEG